MDTSKGAINGDLVNAFTVNGGAFVLDAQAAAAVTMSASARASMRHSGRATASLALAATALARRRSPVAGAAGIVTGSTAVARRRISAPAAAAIVFGGQGGAIRRLTMTATATIQFDSDAALFWRYRAHANRDRRIMVPLERHSALIATRGS